MDAQIRDLRADDGQGVRRLRFRTFSDEDFEPDEDESYIEDERRVVAELDGHVVGHAGAWRFGQFFGGRRVPMAAVAAVLVEPHARGTGVASAMLRRLVDRVVEDGDVIAALYPATASVEPGGDGTVRIDVGALSSLYAGSTPASTWQRLGRLVSEDAAAAALDSVMAGPAPTAAHYF